MPATFNYTGRLFFFTYARTDKTCDDLFQFLQSRRDIRRAVIVKELHADGEPHLHAAVEFSSRLQTRRADFFDFDERHPNVARVRTWGACVNYCRKDGGDETRYYGCTAEDAAIGSPSEGESFDAETACRESQTRLEWLLTALRNTVPYGYADALWKTMHGRQAPTYHDNVVVSGVISNFGLNVREWGPAYRVICILGPSGCGKTTWALRECPTPFLLVTDIDDLGDFDPQVHKAIVFDEIRCTGDEYGKGKWPLTSQIKLTTWDTPVSIRIRYKVAHIPAHVPKIFTCCDTFPFTKDDQILRRVKFINLYEQSDINRWV